MAKHWKENGPPVYISVAGYLGLTKPSKKKSKEKSGDLNDLARQLQSTGGVLYG